MTPSSACERWIDLSDREAVGEPLSSLERRFMREHAASCDSCSAEADVFGDLAALVEPPLERPLDVPERTLARARRPWRSIAAVLAVSVAASVAIALSVRSTTPVETAERLPSSVRLASTSGHVDVDGRAANAGEWLTNGAVIVAREGPACFIIDPGVRACATQGSVIRVVDTSRARRQLEVRTGKIVAELDPQPAGTSFSIATFEGTATAIGTAFSVEVPAGGGPVMTRVMHGTVVVRGADGTSRPVPAHAQSPMNGEVTPLTEADEAREQKIVRQAQIVTHDNPATLRVTSAPPGSMVFVDDRAVGPTPASVLVQPGEHRVELAGQNGVVRETVRLSAGESLERSFEVPLPAPPVTTPEPQKPPAVVIAAPVASAKTPDELLRAAREHRASGDLRGAEASYAQLFASYPESAQGHAARVAFGELALAKGEPAEALRAFDRYLATGGVLAEEATYGKIRALRALGRTEDERAVIDDFLRQFPGGAAAPALAARRRALEDPP